MERSYIPRIKNTKCRIDYEGKHAATTTLILLSEVFSQVIYFLNKPIVYGFLYGLTAS